MDDGEGNDSMDQFHGNEAISAVADEGFLGDEEDEDYEDLYNDVNVGEGFLQSMRGKNEEVGFRSGVPTKEKAADPLPGSDPVVSVPGLGGGGDSGPRIPGRETEGYSQNPGLRPSEVGTKCSGVPSGPVVSGGNGMRVELGPALSKVNEFEEQGGNGGLGHQTPPMLPQPPPHSAGNVGNMGGEGMAGNINGVGGNGVGGGGGAGTILFVGDLHWWTTDAELEGELCKYGQVREVKFFDEKASGKSKGYCQVDFFDPNAATACKEGMNGHLFNGRPCVVAYASPYSVKRMGEAQVNRTQQNASQSTAAQPRRPNDPVGKPGGGNVNTGGNYQGGDNNYRGGFGRGNWGRGNAQGMGNRGAMGHMRGRGGAMGGRGIMGNGGSGFGQGIGATPPLLHPQAMMGQGFDSAFGGPMGRMGNYGGFPGGPTPPFPGILSSYPPVNGVGLPGVAPHVNPAFFGRAMPMNGMGMMPGAVDGPNMGMWADPSMGAWTGEDHGSGRAAESSYGEEAASDHQYGEVSHERGGWPNAVKEKDRGSGSSDRRYERDPPREKEIAPEDWTERTRNRDDNRERERNRDRDRDRERERSRDRERERERDRDRERDSRHSRDDRERYADHHRHRDDRTEHDDEWERGRSSRTHSKARVSQDGDHRPRSKDADSGKRRRLTSE